MSRYRGPVTRLSRRLGVVLFSNGQSKLKAYQKKSYIPGQHGQKPVSQLSEYGKQLQEKQKARFIYGITERQSRNYYLKAQKSKEITGLQYMLLLEQRLDNAVFRAGLANTRNQARQFVSHGLIKVNGKKIDVPSQVIKIGDKLEVKEKLKSSQIFESIKTSKVKPPRWLSTNLKDLKCEVLALPGKDDIEPIVNYNLINEFYSK